MYRDSRSKPQGIQRDSNTRRTMLAQIAAERKVLQDRVQAETSTAQPETAQSV